MGGKRSSNHGGFRVKLCFTITASGHMADVVVIVNGLTEKELPMSPDELTDSGGLRILEIPGLCPGSALNPRSKDSGFLILCRGIEGVDAARHNWYDKKIFSKFVKYLREERFEVTGNDSPIFRSWRDGDFSQINALPWQYLKRQWDDSKIGYNKQSANRSGTEQPDLWDGFKILKQSSNASTMKGKPDTLVMHRVKRYLKESKVEFRGKHEAALLSFLGRLPDILGKMATRNNIKKAFVRNGMVDKETGTSPDLFEMLNTIPGKLSASAHDLIMNNFEELFNIQRTKGRIPDEDFQRLGFPKDFGLCTKDESI